MRTNKALRYLAEASSNRLGGAGLVIHAPPFVFRVRSRNKVLAKALFAAYADYELLADDSFIDFDLAVVPSRGLRRWLRPLIELEFDGDHPFAPLPEAQAFPLLEWAMNWCVTTSAHQFLMCHSAVLAKQNLAVILPAPPGSGKSTLCAALMMSGWRLLSDELALISPETGELTPFVRPVSLKNASIPLISRRFPEAMLTDPVADTIKGTVAHLVPTENSLNHAKTNALPRWLIFPRFVAGAAYEAKALGKAEAVVELAKNAFNLPVLGVKGLDALISVVENSDCFEMCYSDLTEAIARFDALSTDATSACAPL